MGSDRARISYDKSRQYRAVVMQQGRVTVEADWNEAWQIADEEVRKQVLGIVGPSGTPDNGYLVGPGPTSPPFDFSVGKGTMYVGGLRAYLPKSIMYSNQAEWLNSAYDSDWVDPSKTPTENEFVYLFLQEQEVSAVEDTALLEVALGGPDTAQRIRLVQRIKRLSVPGASDCAGTLTAAMQQWQTKGFTFDPATMRLLPGGTLQASFQQLSGTTNPCEPQSTGGYLGADNQLIRIQISDYDQTTQTYSFVWGFDNASFIYRVTVDTDEQSIALQSKPIDDFHMLTSDQFVELLPRAVQLDTQDTTDYIAAATGLIANFDVVDAQHIKLTSPLSSLSSSATNNQPLKPTDVAFLRVWQGQITSVTPDNAVTLGTTGLQVTIRTTNNVPLPIGAYWSIAVRPTTSTNAYPARYLTTPQAPDGPRIWACPLGGIGWDSQGFLHTVDCRNQFDNLVTLTGRHGGCCDETISTQDVNPQGTSDQDALLQSIIDKYAVGQPVTICLKPGTYLLSNPLIIGQQHTGLVLEGCGEPVIIQSATGSENNFQDGLVILNQANNITFKGITFMPPTTQFFQGQNATIAGLGITALQGLINEQYRLALEELFVSIGIRVLSCNQLKIKNCIFKLPFTSGSSFFGAGIFAGGNCQGFFVQENQFMVQERIIRIDQILHQYNTEFANQIKQRYHMQVDDQLLENFEQKVLNQIVSTEHTPSEKLAASTTGTPSAGQIIPKELLAFTFGNNLFGCLFTPTTILDDKAVQDDIQTVETINDSLESASKVIAERGGSVLTTSLQDAFFLDNRFTGLAAAALIDASIGTITIERNIVQQCSAGFYLLSSRTLAFNPFRNMVREFDHPTIQALASWMENTQLTPLIQFSSVLARGYPLPQVFNRGLATPFNSANPDTFPFSSSELLAIGKWLESITILFSQESTTSLAPPQTMPLTIDFHTLHILLSITESLVLSQPQVANQENITQLALQISDNTIDLVNRAGEGTSDTALLVWDNLLSTTSSITMGANTLRNLSVEPTIFLLKPVFCTITGNLFLNSWPGNDNRQPSSLLLIPGTVPQSTTTGVAVTGNVFQGLAILPARMLEKLGTAVSSPMNTWAFLNTEV